MTFYYYFYYNYKNRYENPSFLLLNNETRLQKDYLQIKFNKY